MHQRRWWHFAFAEAAVWFTGVAAFLTAYLQYPTTSSRAIIPHFVIMATVLAFLWLLRASIALVPSRMQSFAIFACVFVHVVTISWFVTYYVAVLVGLDSWGQVISWNLIRSYLPQANHLLDAMGHSVPTLVSVGAAGATTLFVCWWWYQRNATWPADLVKVTGKRVFARQAVLCATFIATVFTGTIIFPSSDYKEPLGLSFLTVHHEGTLGADIIFSGLATARTQNEHDAARSTYVGVAGNDKPHVILIVVDALRPDHTGPYGYARNTTPFLNELAKHKATRVIRDVRAACAETSCGVPSMLSSRDLHDFSPKPFTIQEALSRSGYESRFILGGDHINFYGLRQIYGDVDHYMDGSLIKNWYMNDDRWVLEQVKKIPAAGSRPVALKILLMSAHPLGTKQSGFEPFQPAENYRALGFDKTKVQQAVNFYDNGIFFADYALREIFTALREKGYLKKALVVITSDHGEALGEHGQYSHAKGLYEPVLKIPLIFSAFGYEPEPIRTNIRGISQIDIAPTILRELDLPIPESWRGTPLQSAKESDFSYFQQLDEIGILDKRDRAHLWKYWIRLSDSREYLFDIANDPAEAHNLIASPGIGERLAINELRLRVRKLRPVGEARQ